MDTLSSFPRLSGSHSTRNKWITVLVFAPLTYNVLEGCSSFVLKTLREAEMFPGLSESIVELCHGSGFSNSEWKKVSVLVPCLSGLAHIGPLEWSREAALVWGGNMGFAKPRVYIYDWTQSLLLFFFFLMSLSKWTKVVIKLISCVNFFFFFACGCRK